MIWFILIASAMAIWNVCLWLRSPKVLILDKVQLDIEKLALAVMKQNRVHQEETLSCFEHQGMIYVGNNVHCHWHPESCLGWGATLKAALEMAAKSLIAQKERDLKSSKISSIAAEESIRALKAALGERKENQNDRTRGVKN